MHKLSPTEVSALQLKSSATGRGTTDKFFREAALLNVGEALFIGKNEWPIKTPPVSSAFPKRYRSRGEEYRVNTLADDSGWIITRTK